MDCRLDSKRLPNPLALPKAIQTNTGLPFFASLKTSSQSIGLTQSLSNKIGTAVFHFVQNVFLGIDPYPKPFKIKLRLLLAFLTLIRSIKRACFAASH